MITINLANAAKPIHQTSRHTSSRMLYVTREDAAWAAGLFDGEGTVYLHKTRGKSYARVCVGMTDKEPVMEMKRIFGGTVNGPYKKKSKPGGKICKSVWMWNMNGYEKVQSMFELIGPRLCPRRVEQFKQVLEKCGRYKLKRVSPFCGRGTVYGHTLHAKNNEPSCRRCHDAAMQYQREYRADREKTIAASRAAKADLQNSSEAAKQTKLASR